jgi:RimJ/RimL family protein N-acetyltransferase
VFVTPILTHLPIKTKAVTMIELETLRLRLCNGPETRPTIESLDAEHQRYMIEHEDPTCSFTQFYDVVMASYLNARNGSPFGYFDMLPKEASQKIGHINLFPYLAQPETRALLGDLTPDRTTLEAEIGWAVGISSRRQGYAAEAAAAVLAYAFDQLKLGRILAFTEDDNPASCRVMEKINMHLIHQGQRVIGIIERSD